MAKMNILGILLVIFLLASCSYCARNIAPLEFSGIVKDKYLSSYKKMPVILVHSDNNDIKFGPDGGDTLALYQYIHIGDSLIKKKGSYDFKIVHNGEVIWCTIKCW